MGLRFIAVFAAVACLSATVAFAEKQGHLLRYKLQPGQQLTYRVVHSAKTNVRINGTDESSEMHTTSVRSWNVTDVDSEGTIGFDHTIDSVVMTQQNGDEKEIRWDSRSDATPPPQFERVAAKLGQVLDTIRINPRGQVIDRQGASTSNLGMGDITLPLPAEPIRIGGQWSVPREVRVKDKNGTLKLIKVRELYTLEEVQAGVATIAIQTEPLTPIDDQGVRGQLVQQLSSGTIQFDIENGYVVKRNLEWDDEVVGFQGPRSNMEYQARLSEELQQQTAASAGLQSPATIR